MSAIDPRPCLVTGAAGFLAAALVRQLLTEGHRVRGLVRDLAAGERVRAALPPDAAARFELVEGDFMRPADCERAVAGCGVVFHVAAQMTGAVAPLVTTNVVGTRRLIAASAAARVSRFVVVSSIAVYGIAAARAGAPIDEDAALEPHPEWRDPYTFSKVAEEHAARAECARLGLPLVVVRPGVIVGKGRGSFSARVGLRLGRWVLHVAGRRRLPYTHVENCARALLLAGTHAQAEGLAFNVVDDERPSGREVLRAYRRAGRGLRAIPLPYAGMKALGAVNAWYHRRSTGQLPAVVTPYKARAMWRRFDYSNARAKSVLGWRPARFPLETD